MSPATGLASVSLDLDNQWSYMKTHGDPGWQTYPSYLDTLVPRVLAFLAERELTITFFIVGADAAREANREPLKAIADAGHEIGNHSHRHEPWLHRYSPTELDEELVNAEEAIAAATGQRPTGFRGPGYSLSSDTLRALVRHGYRYDASTLPTFIGPLARAYFFRSARLSPEQRAERSNLFGSWRDGLRPLRPYRWEVDGQGLVELPVTTMPITRTPVHLSYLITLAALSPALSRCYFRGALALARVTGVEPSLLLHPLDFLGPDDSVSLAFFPGMTVPATDKMRVVSEALTELGRHRRLATMAEHVRAIDRAGELPTVDAATSDRATSRWKR